MPIRFLQWGEEPINNGDYYYMKLVFESESANSAKFYSYNGNAWINIQSLLIICDNNKLCIHLSFPTKTLVCYTTQLNGIPKSSVDSEIAENSYLVHDGFTAPGTYYFKLTYIYDNFIIENISTHDTYSSICFAELTKIKVQDKETDEIYDIFVKDLDPTLHMVYSCKKNKYINVKLNVASGPLEDFILIEKDLLGYEQPKEDFYITRDHPIIINGKEIKSHNIKNSKKVKLNPQNIYTIVTDDREPILVNNLPALSWGYYSFISKWLKSKSHLWSSTGGKINISEEDINTAKNI